MTCKSKLGDAVYKITKVPSYSSPSKYLLSRNNKPILLANGKKRLHTCMAYLEGYEMDIGDEKIKRLLDKMKGC